MSAEGRVYLDTSALAKWYLNEDGSDVFVAYLNELGVAVVSSLTRTEKSNIRYNDLITSQVTDLTNQQHIFTWDGRDAYGRRVQGAVPVTVRVG